MKTWGLERRRRRRVAALAVVGALLSLPAAAAADPPVLWQTEEGLIGTPRGIAADPDTGETFVSDQSLRLVVLSPWGQLLRTWGWDVVESGPGDTAEDEFEICVPANGDVCKAGIRGTSGAGQFNGAAGVALDSEGNVYVAETAVPRRVQKFTPEGEFLLSFGGGVNQGGGTPENPGDVCTAEHIENGDTCGAGSTGGGPGEFSGDGIVKTVIGITAEDDVYLGGNERVQRFDTGGVFQEEVEVPGEQITSLAVDEDGFIYVAYAIVDPPLFFLQDAKEDVRKLDPGSGEDVGTFDVNNPRAIAVDWPSGDVYAFDRDFVKGAEAKIRHFQPGGSEVEAFGEGLNRSSTGLGTGRACGAEGVQVFHSNSSPGFVRAFGPPPDPDLCPRPEVAPEITDTYPRSAGVSSASVGADINPRFWEDTTYRVQYATAACIEAGGWEAACVQEALSGGALLTEEIVNEPLPAAATLTGLAPDTPHRFRFIAQSSGGGPTIGAEDGFTTYPPNPEPATDCANQLFRVGLSALLADCRAYEMVSPVDKNGGDIRAGINISNIEQIYPQTTPGGDKLTYSSFTSFGDAEGAPFASQYIAQRGGSGWASEAISPARAKNIPGPSSRFLNNQFVAFGESLCQAWLFWDGDPPLGSPPVAGMEGFRKLYERDNCSPGAGAYAPLVRSAPPNAPRGTNTGSFDLQLQGLSADGSQAVYRANDALEVDEGPEPNPGTPEEGSNDQLYEVFDGGRVRLVSVLPGGAASGAPSTVGLTPNYREGNSANAVSGDGETIFWTASLGGAGNPGTLYARLGGSETVKASEGAIASFQAAAADGSAAIYSEGTTLRRFEVEGAAQSTVAGGFRGLVGASEDLSRAYLISTAVLDGEPNPEGEVAQAGGENLFLWEEGEGFAFVARLAAGEGVSFDASAANNDLPLRTSRVTADGAHLAFMSRRALTGYDNIDLAYRRPDAEVFRYAAPAEELSCVSCNPGGARPRGEALGVFGRRDRLRWPDIAALIPGHTGHFRASNVLSADGQRLFFESFDALLPRDVNGTRDVYQWQAAGKGDCEAGDAHFFSQNGGCLALISTGAGNGDSEFLEATPDGSDVFFRTEQSLVSEDPGLVDIYDARVNGGFPPPPPGQAPCEGDACQPASPAPEFPAPSSSEFEGPEGDPAANPCRRRAVRARRLARVAKRSKRVARRLVRRSRARRAPRRARRMARRGTVLAKRAQRNSRAAKRCRRARAANTSGRVRR